MVFLLLLFLLLITPLQIQLDLRHETSTRFRLTLHVWGIPFRIDHTEKPFVPPAPTPSQVHHALHLAPLLPRLKMPLTHLLHHIHILRFRAHLSLAMHDPATNALLCTSAQQLFSLIRTCLHIPHLQTAITPNFLHEKSVFALQCIVFLHLGTLLFVAPILWGIWKEEHAWNIPSAN